MEQKKQTWKDNLHTPTREEQHRYYGGCILPEDFDMQERSLTSCAFRTDIEMCTANPDKQDRWGFLMSQVVLYEYYKSQEEEDKYNEQDYG